MALFYPVVGGGVVLTTEFRRVRRILGVNGPILAHFSQKFVSRFYGFRASKTCFSASGMEIFAWVRLMTGIRQS